MEKIAETRCQEIADSFAVHALYTPESEKYNVLKVIKSVRTENDQLGPHFPWAESVPAQSNGCIVMSLCGTVVRACATRAPEKES